jgi:hypothetical protein
MMQDEPGIEPDSELEIHRRASTSAALNESAPSANRGIDIPRSTALNDVDRKARLVGFLNLQSSVSPANWSLIHPRSYRWVRGDYRLPVQRAIAITEIARSAGTNLTLENLSRDRRAEDNSPDALFVAQVLVAPFPLQQSQPRREV